MKSPKAWKNFLMREWLLLGSFTGLLLTSLYLKRFPKYSFLELKVLFILFVFLIIIKGLENSLVLKKIASEIEKGSRVAFKLVLSTFFLSMFITNDVALLVLVPLTLCLEIEKKALLVILEALAANAGSALTPFGNPQNLFIYWYYHLKPWEFLKSIAPFSLTFLLLVGLTSFFLLPVSLKSKKKEIKLGPSAPFYLIFLVVFILAALRLLPVAIGVLVFFYALFKDRSSLNIDYALLGTFFCLFGLTENLKFILLSSLKHPEHVFLLAAGLSQIISNVPAALLLAKFTIQWKPLLWGVSVGGFGNLIGSLANLIAYRLFVLDPVLRKSSAKFLLEFTFLGYLAFGIGVALFYLVIR